MTFDQGPERGKNVTHSFMHTFIQQMSIERTQTLRIQQRRKETFLPRPPILSFTADAFVPPSGLKTEQFMKGRKRKIYPNHVNKDLKYLK